MNSAEFIDFIFLKSDFWPKITNFKFGRGPLGLGKTREEKKEKKQFLHHLPSIFWGTSWEKSARYQSKLDNLIPEGKVVITSFFPHFFHQGDFSKKPACKGSQVNTSQLMGGKSWLFSAYSSIKTKKGNFRFMSNKYILELEVCKARIVTFNSFEEHFHFDM